MDIRLDINNIPPQTSPPASVREADAAAQDAPPPVSVSKREFPDFAGAEEVDAATDADVATRDDALGQLFNRAFSYAPPPMPDFT